MIRLRWVLFDNDLDLYRNEMEFREWVNRQAAQQRAHLVEIGTGWGASFRRINLIYGSLPQAAQRFKEWARETRGQNE
jgi:predicted DsbA family dithiol-disulfide isomerase